MKKFKDFIEMVYETGKLPKYLTPCMVTLLPKIYNDLLSRGHSEFIQVEICILLSRCGIQNKPYGIGYQAYI